MSHSEYLQDSLSFDSRKITYRAAKKIAMIVPFEKPGSITAKVCFSAEGIAVQVVEVSSTYSKRKTKQFLKAMMLYRIEPIRNLTSNCPQCGKMIIQNSGISYLN